MTKPILAFCADLQARESAYRAVKELKNDDLYAMSQVVDYCNRNWHRGEPLSLIMGGDQVDTPTISDEHTVELRRVLRGVPCSRSYYVDGNHERGFKRLCLEGGDAAVSQSMEGQVFDIAGFRVAGYNWRTRRQWEAFLESNSLVEADILVLHGFASQVVPALGLPPDEAPLCDMDLEWFDGKYKLVLMGDIHMEWDWRGPKGTRFLYSGSMWMHRLGEPEAKSFIVVHDDLSIERVPLKCRPFLRTEVRLKQDAERIQTWLDSCTELPYISEMRQFMGELLPRIHLTVPSDMAAETQAILAEVKKRAFVFEKIDTSHDRDLTEVKGSLSEKVDLDTALVQLLDVKDTDDREAVEFVKQAMELGFDTAINNLKQKAGIA